MNKYVSTSASVLLGVAFIVFGANGILQFLGTPPPPTDASVLAVMSVMHISYLGKLVAITQMLGGGLVLYPRTKFLGILLLMPVIVNIVFFHLVHDISSAPVWLIIFILFVVVCISEKKSFEQLLKINSNK